MEYDKKCLPKFLYYCMLIHIQVKSYFCAKRRETYDHIVSSYLSFYLILSVQSFLFFSTDE